MRDLDETDLEILRLLLADGRRPYREIADRVGLSPPAVSDRIDRLTEQGVIRRFTVDVDRRKLQDRVPVIVELEADPQAVEAVFEDVLDLPGVEHAYRQFDGTVIAHANAPSSDVDGWLSGGIDFEAVTARDVTLLADYEWQVEVPAVDFAIECAVCGEPVTDRGETARIDGEVKAFCCPTCKSEYTAEYSRHSEEAE